MCAMRSSTTVLAMNHSVGLLAGLLVGLPACGGGDPGASPDATVLDHYDLGSCGAVDVLALAAGTHVDAGSTIAFTHNPPVTGPHYPMWAAYDRSYPSLARGYWLHDAEHGAVVFAYRCDPAAAGCADDIAALEAAVRALPTDPTCTAPVRQRAIVVADPALPADVRIAAVAWGFAYTATCVDPDALAMFAALHYRHATEDTCAAGATLGGTAIAP